MNTTRKNITLSDISQNSFFELGVKKLDPNAILPTRTHPTDAGLDLYALEPVAISPGETKLVSTGIAANFPAGFVGLIADRSSMAKRGFKVLGGIVDAGYTGEVKVLLHNLNQTVVNYVGASDKIAQLLLIPVATPAVVEVSELHSSDRGEQGFGSSGR